MASRSKKNRGKVATSVVDTILGEAVGEKKGFKPTRAQRYNDMLRIASVLYNRSIKTGLPPDQMLTQKEFNAYKKALPSGVEAYRSIAQQAWDYVNLYGPVTKATFYATPEAVSGLPKGLKPAEETVGHKYFTDPQDRPIGTQKGYKGPAKAPQRLPSQAPVPSSRPLDGVGGLGAAYRAAAAGRVAPSSPAVPVGERFGQRPSPTSAPSRYGAVTTQDDLAMQAQPRSPPMGAVSGPLGPAPARPPDQSQRFRPTAAPAAIPTPTARPAYAIDQSQRFRPTAAPAAIPTPTPRPSYTPAAATPAPAPAPPASVNTTAMQRQPASPAIGAVNAPLGPAAASPAALAAARQLGAATAARQIAPQAPALASVANTAMQRQPNAPPLGSVNAPLGPAAAPPAALAAAGNLGTAIAAQQPSPAIPADPRQTAFASMPPATPATLAEKISRPAPAAAPVRAQARAAAPVTGGIPAGVPGPWGADIANQRPGQPGPYGFAGQPAVDRTITGSINAQDPAHPPGFMGKVGDFAQRFGPQIAGTLIAGPLGGFIGGLLGRSFDNALPGQAFGNPFKGMGLGGLGMFQSQAPYAGPKTTVGYGTRAIGSVLGGGMPAGATAYSRSTPGYSITSLGNGVVAKTNQYGFTSYERPGGTGPTGASFSGFTGPGGMFSGGFGGGRKSEKSEQGGRASGGGRSTGGGASGHSKSSRF